MTDYGKLNKVDFGQTSGDYARFRLGFPGSFYKRLKRYKIGLPRQHVLDLATGTGTVARSLALQGCQVTGLDISKEQLHEAEKLDTKADIKIKYLLSPAEKINLPDNSFEIISAGQCWHWFDHQKVLSEVVRLLNADGVLVIAHFDWLVKPGNVVEATEQLILKYNPSWQLSGGDGLYPQWVKMLREYGFGNIREFNYEEEASYSHEAWRGRIRANSGVGAVLSDSDTIRFDQSLKALLQQRYTHDPLKVPHRIFCVIGQSPAKT